MKNAIVMLFILMGAVSSHAQGPTGAGTHTPILRSRNFPSATYSVAKVKKTKKHSDRRMARR
jgi:hypothetical protein